MKINFKFNKKAIIIVSIIVAIALLGTAAWALFSDLLTKQSGIRIGEIKVKLEENWPQPGQVYEAEVYDEFGINLFEKKVKGVSEGDLPAYVRIKCIPVVEYYYIEEGQTEGNWITAAVPQEDISLNITSDHWQYQDGYWYYKNILRAEQETEELTINWEILELPTQLKNYQVRTDVRVMLEYAQTTNNAWKDIFKINELPNGVESAAY